MTTTNTKSAPKGDSKPAVQPADGAAANGTTVQLPNEPPPAGTPPANSQVDPASALPSVANPAKTADPTADFQQALDGARRALTGAQAEVLDTRRENKELRAALDAAEHARRDAETRAALQAVQTATLQAAPLQAPTVAPAVLVPASAINMGASLWGTQIGISGWRIVLGIFVPLLASFAVGSLVYELATIGVTAVATVSGFFLWPLLILVLGAIAAIWAMYKTFGVTHGYIDSGKAEAHWHTVWGWLSSPLRVVETQDDVLKVGAKVDRLLIAQGVTP